MPQVFERSRAATVGSYVIAAPFFAVIALYWTTVPRHRSSAGAAAAGLATVVVVTAVLWHGGVTTSRIELFDDGRLRLCARWRTVETAVRAVVALEVPVPRNLNSRVKVLLHDGRAFWIHAADFPEFPRFSARLLRMNPGIHAVRLPGHWLPQLEPPAVGRDELR